MASIILTTVDGLEPSDANAIYRRLTKSGSEFQIEVAQVLAGESSSDTPLAIWHEDGAVLGWACSHVWKGLQTLEIFTGERHRGRGIASALSAALIAAGVILPTKQVAVFSPSTARIARRLGCDVDLWERRDGAWCRV